MLIVCLIQQPKDKESYFPEMVSINSLNCFNKPLGLHWLLNCAIFKCYSAISCLPWLFSILELYSHPNQTGGNGTFKNIAFKASEEEVTKHKWVLRPTVYGSYILY